MKDEEILDELADIQFRLKDVNTRLTNLVRKIIKEFKS